MTAPRCHARQFFFTGIAAATLLLSACAAPNSRPAQDAADSLTVFAAASLQVPFDQLRTEFQKTHPDLDFPPISYDGSATLVTQIENGAGVDVFASADSATMDRLSAQVTNRTDFATNTLQIAVAPGNPHAIANLHDLEHPDLVVILCAPQVPCGAATQRALASAGAEVRPASEEQSVTSVLTKVRSGEADAGLVYATDVRGSEGAVTGIEVPETSAAVNTYPIAALKSSTSPDMAAEFIAFVTSPRGQQILAAAGFQEPGRT